MKPKFARAVPTSLSLSLAMMLLIPFAIAHPPITDNHYGCRKVGWDLEEHVAPTYTAVTGAVGYELDGELSESVPCGDETDQLSPAAWGSHADSCEGVADGTAVFGALCVGDTDGTPDCGWYSNDNDVKGIVLGVDTNDDGYVTSADVSDWDGDSVPDLPVVSELFAVEGPHSGSTTHYYGHFYTPRSLGPGYLIAFPSVHDGDPLDSSAVTQIWCDP